MKNKKFVEKIKDLNTQKKVIMLVTFVGSII